MLQNCEFFSISKLLYITFLANLEHLVLSLGLIFKWINPPWRWKMEDVVQMMQEIPCFQSLHHEGKDVASFTWINMYGMI
jgi:hypothetical protein